MRVLRVLCALGAVSVCGLMAVPVVAQTAPAANAAAAPQGGVAGGDAAKIESLQQRLLASQQTIATLERELAAAKNRAVVIEECRIKNGRLVFISRELIEGYQKRYKETRKDPLQLGRRRFEFELQALSDAVYTNRIDVPVPPAPGAKRAAETPDPAKPAKKSSKAKKEASPSPDQAPAAPGGVPPNPETGH